jgi:hypothetical protein
MFAVRNRIEIVYNCMVRQKIFVGAAEFELLGKHPTEGKKINHTSYSYSVSS